MKNAEPHESKPATDKQIRQLKFIIGLVAVAGGVGVLGRVLSRVGIRGAAAAVISLYEGYLIITEILEERKERKERKQKRDAGEEI